MTNDNKSVKILGLETSCDETSAAVVRVKIKDKKAKNKNAGQKLNIQILSNIVSSQIDLHRQYGGVYPELASRAHLENILPAIQAALKKAKTGLDEIDAIAVTIGPGLIGSLLVGVETARALAYTTQKPLIAINHLEGHIAANFVGGNPKSEIRNPKIIKFPILALIVSGGHTSLVLMKDFGKYQIIGQTRDDAAGEAFDKVAQIIGLTYPGGPAVEKTVQEFEIKNQKSKIKNSINLPRPMINSIDFDFSFSGLKTAVLQLTKKLGSNKTKKYQAQIAAEFQQAVVDVLITKTIRAAKKFKPKIIMLSGGVAANKLLRKEMTDKIKKMIPNSLFLIPDSQLCTDNAAMIAIAGAYHFLKNLKNKNTDLCKIKANPNLSI